jgi:hypothetical protein
MPFTRLLAIPAAALSLTAAAASTLAEVAQLAARRLSADSPPDDDHATDGAGAATGPSRAASNGGPERLEALRDTAEAIRQDVQTAPSQARELASAVTGLADLSDGATAGAAPRSRTTGRDRAPAPNAHVPRPATPASRNVHPRTFDPEQVTNRPAKEAIAALEDLSSAELSQVYEHESADRRRKTVLRAIEQHVLPPDATRDLQAPEQAARAELRLDTPDITLPSETVYSSESPS